MPTAPHLSLYRVQGTRFVDENCRDFAFVGANAWRVLEGQADVTGVKLDGKTPTEWMFETAAANNISVIRMFATGIDPEKLPLQLSPGQYTEKALQALDETLNLAGKNGVMVTLIFARQWQGPDSLANYASWTATPINDFFTDPDAIKAFLDHLTFMATRVNGVNGKRYSDDATIFSYNLMNEPRFFYNDTKCQSDPVKCADDMNAWIKTTSDHLKSVSGIESCLRGRRHRRRRPRRRHNDVLERGRVNGDLVLAKILKPQCLRVLNTGVKHPVTRSTQHAGAVQ